MYTLSYISYLSERGSESHRFTRLWPWSTQGNIGYEFESPFAHSWGPSPMEYPSRFTFNLYPAVAKWSMAWLRIKA